MHMHVPSLPLQTNVEANLAAAKLSASMDSMDDAETGDDA